MNCLFQDYCTNTIGYQKPSCLVADRETNGHLCSNHFDFSNIVTREGKQFGYEVSSTWLAHKLNGKLLPSQNLYITLVHNKMLDRLNKRLELCSPLNFEHENIFMSLPRPILLDVNIVRQLTHLSKMFSLFNKALVIVFDDQHIEITPYTKQAEYLLLDAGIKFCLKCNLSSHYINIQQIEYLMYSATELQSAIKEGSPAYTDMLFSLNENGFKLVLSDISSPENYSLGLNLPFLFFKP